MRRTPGDLSAARSAQPARRRCRVRQDAAVRRSTTTSAGRGWRSGTRWRRRRRRPRSRRPRGGDLPARDRAGQRLPLARTRASGRRGDDVDRALYDDRTVVKQLAMRRTVFAFPRDLLPAVWGSASARVAAQLRRPAGQGGRGRRARRRRRRPGSGRCAPRCWPSWPTAPATTAELRERSRRSTRRLQMSPGKTLRRRRPGRPARAARRSPPTGSCPRRNDGRLEDLAPALDPRPDWLGEDGRPRWPSGPATPRWSGAGCARSAPAPRPTWSGGWARPRRAVRRALADVAAVEVALDDGATGWLLPDDVDEVGRARGRGRRCCRRSTRPRWAGSSATSTSGEHAAKIFDSNGNGGPTVWWNGRIVGGWGQEPDGPWCWSRVATLPRGARAPLEAEAARLTAWLDGDVVRSIYQSPLARAHPS